MEMCSVTCILFAATIIMQATWLEIGVPICFTTALAVCSLHPVAIMTIQGVLHVVSGVLLPVCNVAIDVNLNAILQTPLCDVSYEPFMDVMTACAYAVRGLSFKDTTNVFALRGLSFYHGLGHDHEFVVSQFSNMFTLSSYNAMYAVLWTLVLMWTFSLCACNTITRHTADV